MIQTHAIRLSCGSTDTSAALVGDQTTRQITLLADSRTRSSSFQKPKPGGDASKMTTMAKISRNPRKSKRNKQKARHISFAPLPQYEQCVDAPVIHSKAHLSDLWYSFREMERFMKQAQQEAKTLQSTDEEGYVESINQSHSIALQIAHSVTRDETILYRIFNGLEMDGTGLAVWCLESPHRGLERLASKHLRRAKHDLRVRLGEMVRILCREERVAPELLAHRYQQRTKESRLFARMMGLADELAAKAVYERNEDDCVGVVEVDGISY